MNNRMTELVALARELRSLAMPTRAALLDILAVANTDLLATCCSGEASQEHHLRILGDELGYPHRVVTEVVSRFCRLDLTDYSLKHEDARIYYVSADPLTSDISAWLQGQYQSHAIHFVLHNMIFRWAYAESAVYGVGIENNTINKLCKGYLVHSNLAFGSTVELLHHSFLLTWPEWKSLWKLY